MPCTLLKKKNEKKKEKKDAEDQRWPLGTNKAYNIRSNTR